LFLCYTIPLFSQNVGINETGNTPNLNAILDIDADSNNDKGVLIPRLTSAQRDAISGLGVSDEGLTIYNTTTSSFWYWDGTQWLELTGNINQEVGNAQDPDQEPTGFIACTGGPYTTTLTPTAPNNEISLITGWPVHNYDEWTIPVSTTGNICDLNINLTTHSKTAGYYFYNVLDIDIIHPDATVVRFFDGYPNCSNKPAYGYHGFSNTTFDDEASGARTICPNSANPYANGTYTPDASLSTFDGKAANGNWKIRFYYYNLGGSYKGILDEVKLIIKTEAEASWEYVGKASITYKTGRTPVIQAYYSANSKENYGCKIRISRSTVNDNTTVGTVLGYSADSPHKGDDNTSPVQDYWVNPSIVIEDDAALTNNITYYYKLWKAGDVETNELNYSIVPILIEE